MCEYGASSEETVTWNEKLLTCNSIVPCLSSVFIYLHSFPPSFHSLSSLMCEFIQKENKENEWSGKWWKILGAVHPLTPFICIAKFVIYIKERSNNFLMEIWGRKLNKSFLYPNLTSGCSLIWKFMISQPLSWNISHLAASCIGENLINI